MKVYRWKRYGKRYMEVEAMQVLVHNLMAQFTNRQLNITTGNKSKAAERLSSGYRINRTADDAAGLTISEKMRWQIRGLNQASDNIQNGISLIQVADGALEETHSVLQRMRELAVQAANDTNTEADRQAVQKEINQLTEEVDRIANDTNFNSEIYPLLGTQQATYSTITYNPSNLISGNETVIAPSGYSIVNTGHVGFYSFSYETIENAGKFRNAINGLHLEYQAKYLVSTMRISGDRAYLDIRQTDMDDTEMYNAIVKETVPAPQLTVAEGRYEILNDGRYKLDFGETFGYIIIGRSKGEDIPIALNKNGILMANTNTSKVGLIVPQGKYYMDGQGSKLWIQMGAQKDQGMFLSLVDATAKGIGLTSLDVSSYEKSGNAITMIDDAIDVVSEYRSCFGAQQNRLEHAKTVDDNTAENTQSAEAKLRDTDMSEEMVEYSKHSILEQTGQAILAQSNQSTQGVLSLLQ